MTTPTLLLILWSALCLGTALAATDKPSRVTYVIPNVGFGLIFWSVGIGLWMVAGFVVRAI